MFSTLPVTAQIELPAANCPTPAAIVGWFEKALRAEGADTQRPEEDLLEFTTSASNAMGRGNWEPTLEVVSGGTLYVEPTDRGFRVRVDAKPRLWLLSLSLLWFALVVGGFAFSGPPLTYLLGFGGLPVVLIAWGVAWVNVRLVLVSISHEIVESYTRTPIRPLPGT